MTGSPLPRTGRVHPFVVAKVASEDRKGFVRNYLSAHTGVSLKAVQELLGHSELATSQI